MVCFRWTCSTAATALLSFASANASDPKNPATWFNPHDDKSQTDWTIFHIGERQNLTFDAPFQSYTVSLWQEHVDFKGASAGRNLIYEADTNNGYFVWKVDIQTFNLNDSDVFFFWMWSGTNPKNQNNTNILNSSSPYFKIAKALAPSSTASASSSGTASASNAAAAATTANTSSAASSGGRGGSLSAGASAGIGVGVGLGVIAVVGVGALCFRMKRYANKTSQLPPQKSYDAYGNPANKHHYTPVARKPLYYQNTAHSSPALPSEVPADRPPVEIG